jgi:hypothetical protein
MHECTAMVLDWKSKPDSRLRKVVEMSRVLAI